MILIIKHVEIEGPGYIGDFFRQQGYEIETIELEKGDKLPRNISNFQAVVIMGGPMNVYEEKKYPFLADEEILIRNSIIERIPILGICLGAQMLAKAASARIVKNNGKEIGWYKVRLTENAKQDELFQGVEGEFDCFQWHEDTFDIPRGAELLLTSNKCRNQAFRYGANAYGLQFHFEVNEKMIEDWIKAHAGEFKSKQEAKKLLTDYELRKERFSATANKLCVNFSRIVNKR